MVRDVDIIEMCVANNKSCTCSTALPWGLVTWQTPPAHTARGYSHRARREDRPEPGAALPISEKWFRKGLGSRG